MGSARVGVCMRHGGVHDGLLYVLKGALLRVCLSARPAGAELLTAKTQAARADRAHHPSGLKSTTGALNFSALCRLATHLSTAANTSETERN